MPEVDTTRLQVDRFLLVLSSFCQKNIPTIIFSPPVDPLPDHPPPNYIFQFFYFFLLFSWFQDVHENMLSNQEKLFIMRSVSIYPLPPLSFEWCIPVHTKLNRSRRKPMLSWWSILFHSRKVISYISQFIPKSAPLPQSIP